MIRLRGCGISYIGERTVYAIESSMVSLNGPFIKIGQGFGKERILYEFRIDLNFGPHIRDVSGGKNPLTSILSSLSSTEGTFSNLLLSSFDKEDTVAMFNSNYFDEDHEPLSNKIEKLPLWRRDRFKEYRDLVTKSQVDAKDQINNLTFQSNTKFQPLILASSDINQVDLWVDSMRRAASIPAATRLFPPQAGYLEITLLSLDLSQSPLLTTLQSALLFLDISTADGYWVRTPIYYPDNLTSDQLYSYSIQDDDDDDDSISTGSKNDEYDNNNSYGGNTHQNRQTKQINSLHNNRPAHFLLSYPSKLPLHELDPAHVVHIRLLSQSNLLSQPQVVGDISIPIWSFLKSETILFALRLKDPMKAISISNAEVCKLNLTARLHENALQQLMPVLRRRDLYATFVPGGNHVFKPKQPMSLSESMEGCISTMHRVGLVTKSVQPLVEPLKSLYFWDSIFVTFSFMVFNILWAIFFFEQVIPVFIFFLFFYLLTRHPLFPLLTTWKRGLIRYYTCRMKIFIPNLTRKLVGRPLLVVPPPEILQPIDLKAAIRCMKDFWRRSFESGIAPPISEVASSCSLDRSGRVQSSSIPSKGHQHYRSLSFLQQQHHNINSGNALFEVPYFNNNKEFLTTPQNHRRQHSKTPKETKNFSNNDNSSGNTVVPSFSLLSTVLNGHSLNKLLSRRERMTVAQLPFHPYLVGTILPKEEEDSDDARIGTILQPNGRENHNVSYSDSAKSLLTGKKKFYQKFVIFYFQNVYMRCEQLTRQFLSRLQSSVKHSQVLSFVVYCFFTVFNLWSSLCWVLYSFVSFTPVVVPLSSSSSSLTTTYSSPIENKQPFPSPSSTCSNNNKNTFETSIPSDSSSLPFVSLTLERLAQACFSDEYGESNRNSSEEDNNTSSFSNDEVEEELAENSLSNCIEENKVRQEGELGKKSEHANEDCHINLIQKKKKKYRTSSTNKQQEVDDFKLRKVVQRNNRSHTFSPSSIPSDAFSNNKNIKHRQNNNDEDKKCNPEPSTWLESLSNRVEFIMGSRSAPALFLRVVKAGPRRVFRAAASLTVDALAKGPHDVYDEDEVGEVNSRLQGRRNNSESAHKTRTTNLTKPQKVFDKLEGSAKKVKTSSKNRFASHLNDQKTENTKAFFGWSSSNTSDKKNLMQTENSMSNNISNEAVNMNNVDNNIASLSSANLNTSPLGLIGHDFQIPTLNLPLWRNSLSTATVRSEDISPHHQNDNKIRNNVVLGNETLHLRSNILPSQIASNRKMRTSEVYNAASHNILNEDFNLNANSINKSINLHSSKENIFQRVNDMWKNSDLSLELDIKNSTSHHKSFSRKQKENKSNIDSNLSKKLIVTTQTHEKIKKNQTLNQERASAMKSEFLSPTLDQHAVTSRRESSTVNLAGSQLSDCEDCISVGNEVIGSKSVSSNLFANVDDLLVESTNHSQRSFSSKGFSTPCNKTVQYQDNIKSLDHIASTEEDHDDLPATATVFLSVAESKSSKGQSFLTSSANFQRSAPNKFDANNNSNAKQKKEESIFLSFANSFLLPMCGLKTSNLDLNLNEDGSPPLSGSGDALLYLSDSDEYASPLLPPNQDMLDLFNINTTNNTTNREEDCVSNIVKNNSNSHQSNQKYNKLHEKNTPVSLCGISLPQPFFMRETNDLDYSANEETPIVNEESNFGCIPNISQLKSTVYRAGIDVTLTAERTGLKMPNKLISGVGKAIEEEAERRLRSSLETGDVVYVWENQRRGFGSTAGFSTQYLLPFERPAFTYRSDSALAPGLQPVVGVFSLEWTVASDGITDDDGWQYSHRWSGDWHNLFQVFCFVRRRLLIARVVGFAPHFLPIAQLLKSSPTSKSNEYSTDLNKTLINNNNNNNNSTKHQNYWIGKNEEAHNTSASSRLKHKKNLQSHDDIINDPLVFKYGNCNSNDLSQSFHSRRDQSTTHQKSHFLQPDNSSTSSSTGPNEEHLVDHSRHHSDEEEFDGLSDRMTSANILSLLQRHDDLLRQLKSNVNENQNFDANEENHSKSPAARGHAAIFDATYSSIPCKNVEKGNSVGMLKDMSNQFGSNVLKALLSSNSIAAKTHLKQLGPISSKILVSNSVSIKKDSTITDASSGLDDDLDCFNGNENNFDDDTNIPDETWEEREHRLEVNRYRSFLSPLNVSKDVKLIGGAGGKEGRGIAGKEDRDTLSVSIRDVLWDFVYVFNNVIAGGNQTVDKVEKLKNLMGWKFPWITNRFLIILIIIFFLSCLIPPRYILAFMIFSIFMEGFKGGSKRRSYLKWLDSIFFGQLIDSDMCKRLIIKKQIVSPRFLYLLGEMSISTALKHSAADASKLREWSRRHFWVNLTIREIQDCETLNDLRDLIAGVALNEIEELERPIGFEGIFVRPLDNFLDHVPSDRYEIHPSSAYFKPPKPERPRLLTKEAWEPLKAF